MVSPRVGKSKIIIDALSSLDGSILIVAPFNSILDAWEIEIQKWNKSLRERITLVNQRSITNDHRRDILICDECHTLSEAQIKKILSLKFKSILGSTGTLSDSSRKALKPIIKDIIYEYSIKQAIQDGIISNYSIKVITCQLDNKNKYVPAGTVKKPFLTTEIGAYNYYTKQFNFFKVLGYKDRTGKYDNIKYMYAGKRARLLYSTNSKLEITKNVINKLNDKKLVFTVLTDTADKLSKYSYHSKIKAADRESNLARFKRSRKGLLSVCGMLSMGFTDKKLKIGIFHQLQSSEEQAQQKIMRMCNFVEEGIDAEIYILVYENTVDMDWLQKALAPFDQNKIEYDTFRNWI